MHIEYLIDVRDPASTVVRSVRLGAQGARIGRGAICEVQLRAPRLGMIECQLRHDAGAWRLCPFGSNGQAVVGGEPIRRPTLIKLDEPFTIGPFELCLRAISTESQPNLDGTRARPIDARVPERRAAQRSAEPTLAKPPEWVERPRTTQPARVPRPIPSTLAPSREEVRPRWDRPRGEPVPSVRTPIEPNGVARVVETPPAREQADAVPVPMLADVVVPPPTESAHEPVPARVESSNIGEVATEPPPAGPSVHEASPSRELGVWLDADELAGRHAWDESDAPSTTQGNVSLLVEHDFEFCVDAPIQTPPAEPESVPRAEPVPVPCKAVPVDPDGSREPVMLSQANDDWPSTRAILEAHRARPRSRTGEPRSLPAHLIASTTEIQQPRAFRIRSRWAVGVLVLVAMIPSLLVTGIAGRIAADNQLAGRMHAALNQTDANAAIAREAEPNPAWWSTSSAHVATRAAVLSRDAEAGGLDAAIDFGMRIAPRDALLSYGWAIDAAPGGDSDAKLYHPSADVWPLATGARMRFKAGQPDRALEQLHDAYEIAVHAAVDFESFSRTTRVGVSERQSHLPNEALFAPLSALLVDQDRCDVPELEGLVPAYAPAWLSLARTLEQRGKANRGVLEHVTKLPDDAPDGASAALHLAARAEAWAATGELGRGIEELRAAIALGESEPWVGVLWLNLSGMLTKNRDPEGALAARRMAQKLARRGGVGTKPLLRMIQVFDAENDRDITK